ncbi:XRE family transcriptional regulator [Jeotgalibacillus sp. S-D1]|uniref:XRE family transcriptional regulator n=1 Tax=Jeotgalibacillus sp. S-D1 TaxID=2552189 RepID=UPI00105A7088|nr:XRE family transcriptional regulator [Jeotgalibacillus sp. S-D1]TDL32020.1 XRE family transcriptional regulator [Jeotgalibacillus sp. S-D1]
MDDLLKQKATYWKIRLKNCMYTYRYTQVSFAEALNEKYGTSYGQKDVSRWMNTGAKIKNGEVGFPKFDTMLLIADFFSVDVGYLTGETDEISFSVEKACSYIGLNGEAIKAIREITQPENENSYMRKDMRETFNKLFSAKGFPNFFDKLQDLHLASILLDQENRVFKTQDSAIDYIRGLEYKGKIIRYELNEALVQLVNELYPNPPHVDLNINE